MKQQLLSLIVSVYNEEEVLYSFYRESKKVLEQCKWDYELVFVNDGSIDKSLEILNELSRSDKKVKVIHFSRNFGHEAAMIAGIDYCKGDGLICMDADLQHPVSLIPTIIEHFENGSEVISMVRTENKSAGIIKNITSSSFYHILNLISSYKFESNASDFFALRNNAANVLKNEYRERVRFLRGYVQCIGFNKTTIEYEANERFAGHSKYNIKKLIKFSINALLSFSNAPLRISSIFGCFVGILGLILMIYTIYEKIVNNTPNGYATIIVVICFMFAILFLLIGIIGEYIGIIFAETKQRPLYIVKDTHNIKGSVNYDLNDEEISK